MLVSHHLVGAVRVVYVLCCSAPQDVDMRLLKPYAYLEDYIQAKQTGFSSIEVQMKRRKTSSPVTTILQRVPLPFFQYTYFFYSGVT